MPMPSIFLPLVSPGREKLADLELGPDEDGLDEERCRSRDGGVFVMGEAGVGERGLESDANGETASKGYPGTRLRPALISVF